MSDKFNRKKFLANVEAFMEEKRAAWVRDMVGTPLEPYALTYAIREFILPNEDLNSITANDLFPNVDLGEWAVKCEKGIASREDASKAIRAAVVDGLREVNVGVERIRHGGLVPQNEPALEAMGVPPLPDALRRAEPQISHPGPVKGIPEACASDVARVHRAVFGGRPFYTLDRDMMERLQAAQVQGITLLVESIAGDHGERITKATVTDP